MPRRIRTCGLEARSREQLPVVRDMRLPLDEQRPQASGRVSASICSPVHHWLRSSSRRRRTLVCPLSRSCSGKKVPRPTGSRRSRGAHGVSGAQQGNPIARAYMPKRSGRTCDHVYCSAVPTPALLSAVASLGSARTRSAAAAIAPGSRGGTSSAVLPFSTTWGIPPTSVVTIATPLAIASSKEIGILSTVKRRIEQNVPLPDRGPDATCCSWSRRPRGSEVPADTQGPRQRSTIAGDRILQRSASRPDAIAAPARKRGVRLEYRRCPRGFE